MSNRRSRFVHPLQSLPSALAGGPRRLAALAAVLALLALALLPTTAQAQVDTTSPAPQRADVLAGGTVIEIAFDEAFDDSISTVPISLVSVTADGNTITVGMVAVVVDTSSTRSLVQLQTLSPAITNGQVVTVSYTDPTTGDDASVLEDATGNEVASFTTGSGGVPAVVNNVPPALESATVEPDGKSITLVFDGLMVDDPFFNSFEPTAHFSVTADGNPITVREHGVYYAPGSSLIAYIQLHRLTPGMTRGQVVTVSYTPTTVDDPDPLLQDAAGNGVAAFTTGSGGVPDVVNNVRADLTPPALESATVLPDGATIELVFDEAIDDNISTVNSALVTATADGNTITVGQVAVGLDPSSTRRLVQLQSLSPAITHGQAVTVSYRDPDNDNTSVLQDPDGNDVVSFTTGSGDVPAVVNNVPLVPTVEPTVLWSDTMTVGSFPNTTFVGWNDTNGYGGSSLSDQEFDYGEHTYDIETIAMAAGGENLTFRFNETGAGDIANAVTRNKLTLHVGSMSFKMTDGSLHRTNRGVVWPSSGLSWAAGDMVALKLTTTDPGAPGLTATPGPARVTLSWTPPTTSGGSAITGYEYRQRTGGDYAAGAWTPIPNSASLTSYNVTGLTADTAYTFQLRARNSTGAGLYSAEATATPTADTTPPTLESATVEDMGVLIQMNFSEDLHAGNPPPASSLALTADGSPVAIGMVGLGLLDNEFVLDGLDPTILMGQTVVVTYTDPTASDDAEALQDAAGNDVASFTTGSGDVPAVVNNSTVAAPGPPQNVVAEAFTGRVTLDWDAPASDGGSPITHYEYRLKRDTGSFGDWELADDRDFRHVLGADGTSLVFRGIHIRSDETFTYEVRAVSDVGPGAAQASNAILTAPQVSMRVEAADVRVSEGVGTVTINAVLEIPDGWGPYDQDLKNTLTSDQGTALVGEDYVSVSVEFTFAAQDFVEGEDGRWSATSGVEVAILDDGLSENEESFTVKLQRGASAPNWVPNPNSNNITTITIEDDDVLMWSVTAAPAAIEEDGGVSTVTVRTNDVEFPADQTITLTLGTETGAATPGTDFTIANSAGAALSSPYTLTLPMGEVEVAATITASADTVDDGDETVTITALLGAEQIGETATVTIVAAQLAPSDLTATLETGDVRLNWNAPVDAAASVTGYTIFRANPQLTPPAPLAIYLSNTGDTNTTYLDTEPVSGTRNTYRVAARRGSVGSETSKFAFVDVPPPSVSSVALTSAPGSDNTYAIGDTVTATVTFDQEVDIAGAPQLELDFAGTAKAAACTTATNTTTMVCEYEVVAGDSATNGVAIAADKLTGGTITATGSTTITADLDHLAVAIDAGHKVDGIRPTLESAETGADGASIDLVFDEPYEQDAAFGLLSTAFSVTADGSTVTIGSLDVLPDADLEYRTVGLTELSPDITYGQVVTVSYTDATAGDDATGVLQDEAGNDVASFTTGSGGVPAVVNNVPADGTPPPAVDIDAKDSVEVLEGRQAGLEVRLRSAPSTDVTVTVTLMGNDAGKVTVMPASLAFTTANWNDYQELDLATAEDSDSSDETVTLTLSGAGLTTKTVTVDVADGDMSLTTLPPSVSLTEGGTATIDVTLASAPSARFPRTVAVSSWDEAAVTVATPSLTFTSTDWNQAHTVTFTGEQDGNTTGERVTISFRSRDVQEGTVTVIVTDDDGGGGGGGGGGAPLNRSPEFTDGSMTDRSIAENTLPGADIGEPVAATDPDTDTLTYSLSGADAESFAIVAATGQIQVGDGTILDYEAEKNTYVVQVTATDSSGATAMIAVTIAVTNLDEAGTVTLSPATPVIDTELTATLGDPDGGVTGVTWQWARDNTTGGTFDDIISGATSESYTPVDADTDMYLRVTASYTDGHGTGKSTSAVSDYAVTDYAVTDGDPLFARYDANGNGMIDKAEVIQAINDYLFGEGDEAISKAEVIRLINLYLFGGGGGAVTDGDLLFARYDANGNGMIDKAEVIQAINDYLFGEGDEAISKAEVIELINLYLFG